jgi:hypothetical protein
MDMLVGGKKVEEEDELLCLLDSHSVVGDIDQGTLSSH